MDPNLPRVFSLLNSHTTPISTLNNHRDANLGMAWATEREVAQNDVIDRDREMT